MVGKVIIDDLHIVVFNPSDKELLGWWEPQHLDMYMR
jgi:hypothetical protein